MSSSGIYHTLSAERVELQRGSYTLSNPCNFQSFEVVDRGSETQLQMTEK